MGASLGALPVANLVVFQVGAGLGLLLLTVNGALLPVAAGIAVLGLLVAAARWNGRWLTQWIALTARYTFRSHLRTARQSPADAQPESGRTTLGEEDRRVALLRLAVPDLVVAQATDHDRNLIGLAWHEGTWTAVLLVDPAPGLITKVGSTPNLPLSALAPCLEDRGVVLDSIQVISHCYPGSAALPATSPALASYLEVLGPLPTAARRTTWVAVRLDPQRCLSAIRERGGGVVGAHRALLGALSRVGNALAAKGVQTRPLDTDELLRAGISAAELTTATGNSEAVQLRERWTGVTAAGVGHASYAVTGWPNRGGQASVNALTGVRALSATVSVAISPSDEDGNVGLRGLVRVSARTPKELEQADERLQAISERLGLSLTPLRGVQLAGFAASLPLGGNT